MLLLAAKPTIYGPYTFRSQLEARWAYFFDLLGIRYRYEPKLFCLRSDLWYLPDFWLPDHRCFVEIKGEQPEQREKMRLLARKVRVNVYTFFGDVGVPDVACRRGAYVDYGDDHYFVLDKTPDPVRIRYPLVRPGQLSKQACAHLLNAYGRWGKDYGWCECQRCGMVVIATSNPTLRWQCACPEPLSAPHTLRSPRLLAAYRAANAYHFAPSASQPVPAACLHAS
ncbi:hypothetical protein KSF_106980 [Reticulibacter mediterranei]|uniref:Uncharacterized protein n=1 Tax=Reticulibacter mediterranei TaxID=2778369 RepID=A0A8J3J1L9_9CHLR|nr:hypothetical protein [Reticulibacter mediterranei]GHP00651.1 hypothetical protein KSF_106980 [Reticulibacter mediterranei]